MTNRMKILLMCWILLLLCVAFLHKQEQKNEVWVKQPVQEREELEEQKEAAVLETKEGQEPGRLYALSAVLMDGDTGRVLYEKEGEVPRPNASTTKVLTCILALEMAKGEEIVKTSARAAAQPDVQLNMIEGEQFYLEDLLYSLMLKSHNDTAVAIAEHISGSVEAFAAVMNEKAKALGCTDTYFITPNGLDERDAVGVHSTTARDLAIIMSYAIQNETFLKITQTRSYSFWDVERRRQFQVNNANAFLDMMDGVISGKTGFTADAGYCYVCALQRDERTFVVALLGCGWPNNKTYKWKDSRTLLEYGLSNYENRVLWEEPDLPSLPVKGSVPPVGKLNGENRALLFCEYEEEAVTRQFLLRKDEQVQVKYRLPGALNAPVREGQRVGEIQYCLDGKVLCQYPVKAAKAVEKLNFSWCMEQIFQRFFQETESF